MTTLTYLALMLLLALSVYASGPWSLAISVIKTALVGYVFMELRYASRLLLLLGLGALFWVGLMYWLTLTDYWTR